MTPLERALRLTTDSTTTTTTTSSSYSGASSTIMSDEPMSLYETCAVAFDGQTDAVLQCVANHVQQKAAKDHADLISWLLVLAGALVFFMQAGFAMLCAGCVRKKNVQNTMLKNLLDACGAAIAFYTVGYAFAFGGQDDASGKKSFLGTENFFSMGDVDAGFWFFEYAFSATAVTIVAGTLAERCQMSAYLCYSVFLTGFVYPVAARAVWSTVGILSAAAAEPFGDVGVIDFAGSGVVHVTGGMTAFWAAYMLGARKGRFHDTKGRPLDTPKEFPGHSIALQLLGTMILWFGWYGFNPGSALLLGVPNAGSIAALAAVNTSLAAAAGAVGALFTNLYLEERKTGDYSFNLTMAMNGLLSGLVAVTASCGTIEPWAAMLIGLIGGWLYMGGSALLIKWKIDDAVDAIPVHLVNGAWGLIAVGLFSSPSRTAAAFGTDEHVGWFYSMGRGSLDMQLLCNQLVALLFLAGWATVTMLPFFTWLNYMGWLRADSLEELVGLDMSFMGGAAGANSTNKNATSGGGGMAASDDDEVKEEHIAAYEQKKRASPKNAFVNNGDNNRRTVETTADLASVDTDDEWNDLTTAPPRQPQRR